jgi:tetratricopeptide (TPR) repeat protein
MSPHNGQDKAARRMADVSRDLEAGFAHHQAGRRDRAETIYRRVLRKVPNHVEGLHLLGVIAHERGRHQQAVQLISRALARSPGFVDAHLNLGAVMQALGRLDEASASYRTAIALKPDAALAHCNLSTLLNSQGAFEEALESARRALELMPRHTNAHLNCAGALAGLHRFTEAELGYRDALALQPEKAEALWSRFDEARACFHRALELDPEQPDADAGLGFIGQRAGDEEQLQRLRILLASPDRPTAVRSKAGFAIGTLLDNADRYDEAFACFSAANALRRQQLAASGEVFDLAALRRQVDGLIESCTPALYSMVEGDANPSEMLVFIVGMPRSGTSLIEQIAATHSRVSGAGERKDISTIVETIQAHGRDRPAEQLNPDLATQLADGYVAHLQSLGIGAERVIDKMPDNILYLGTIALLFPMARIIFCRRDLRDTCLSCYFHQFHEPVPYAQDLVDCVLRAQEIERLADHWRSVLPLRMLTIDHEALVADLEGESLRLIEFLGLDWEPACLDFYKTERPVLTASAWQVRQPLFNRSVGRWRHYDRHLGPLLEALAKGGATGESGAAP